MPHVAKHLEALIADLRSKGVPEGDLRPTAEELLQMSCRDSKYFCQACGRSSDAPAVEMEIDGKIVFSPPTSWVYCYREQGEPLGLCNQCFHLRRFDGFTADEIAYLEERFAEGFDAETDDDL